MAETVTIVRSIGGLTFDAVVREDHSAELEVTENPIETGVAISDHAYMRPLTVTITAAVSDSPLRQVPSDPYAGSSVSRHRRAFELLSELQRTSEPFDVQSGLKLYRSMVVKSLSTSQDKDSSNILIFTAMLREVIISNTEIVNYTPREPGPVAEQATAPKARGEQQGNTVSPSPVPANQSLAVKLRNKFATAGGGGS